MKSFYEEEIISEMKLFFDGLPEKDRRHYAAIEANKLGHGGISYISQILGINRHAIYLGKRELANPILAAQIPTGKQRRPGGGRKKKKKKSEN